MTTKILFVYAAEYLGSAWTVCKQIIDNLDPERFQVYVVIDVASAGDIGLRENHGVSVHRWDLGPPKKRLAGRFSASARAMLGLTTLAHFARSHGIQVIHSNEDGRSATLSLVLARLTGAKLLVHYHTIPQIYSRRRRSVMKWIAKLADFNVGVSRFVANELQALGVPAKKIGFVVNGVNVERFSPGIDAAAIRAEYGIAEDEILVMQLSRIWKEKRQEDLVRAFAIARTSVTSLRCLIVGWEDPRYGGPFASYLDELQHIRSKLNLGNDIIFGKPRPEAPELHAAADIEVLASVGEPCGLVVLEAMASGTAIIGARSGGIPELIDDGVNGFLVSPESPDLLAQKIVTLSLDPNLREQIGKAGRQKVVEFFSEARVSEQFARIYEALAHHQAVPKRSSLE